jgi:DNA-binding MarR family transcriptional regulator
MLYRSVNVNESPSVKETTSVDTPGDPVDACLHRYGQMMRALLHVRATSGAWNEMNVTLPQIRVLSLLAGHAEGLSGRALAGLLGVGPSAVTPLVDRLVDHSYVRREEDRHDRRITRLLLTPAGATVLHQMAAGRREILAEVLQRLSAEELATVERAFELVALGVQRASPSAAAAPATCAPTATHGPSVLASAPDTAGVPSTLNVTSS